MILYQKIIIILIKNKIIFVNMKQKNFMMMKQLVKQINGEDIIFLFWEKKSMKLNMNKIRAILKNITLISS